MAKNQAAPARQIIIRRYQRVNYNVPVVLHLGDHTLTGNSNNISEGGMEVTAELVDGLIADDLLRTQCVASFGLPHFPADLRVGARIVWLRGQGPVTLGLQFLHGLPRVAVFIMQEMIRKQLML